MALEPYIPYKGNKFQILDDIYTTIRTLDIPPVTAIVDPFCGGGSFTYFMAQHGYKVLANDLDTSVVLLHQALQLWGNSNDFETLTEWTKRSFTKAQFKAMLNDDSAFGAFVRSIWSFGNDGRTYLTSDEKEAQKLEDFAAGTAEPNSRAKHIVDIALAYTRQKLDISFTNLSYEQVNIPENALVYLDPPYAGTAGYRSGDFDTEAFHRWALNLPNLCLISEYEMPEPFVLVAEYPKWVESGRGARTKMGVERLYANKPVQTLMLF